MKQSVKIKFKNFTVFLLILIIYTGCKGKKVKNKAVSLNTNSHTKKVNQQKTKYNFTNYENNKDYFIRNIDINKDGILDKVVCSDKFKGNELLFFQNNNDNYDFVIKTINFSEDGGRIIDDILPEKKLDCVLKVKTFFPDGGLDEASYYIEFKNGEWKLKKTIYKTRYWQKDATKTYICEVKQDILMNELINEEGVKKINRIPEERDRQKKCKSFIENK